MVLVIGYGNLLRSDDGVGQQVANAVADWQMPHVETLACVQLTPELSARMAEADLVIFVDAQRQALGDEVGVHTLWPTPELSTRSALSHHIGPGGLLMQTQQLFKKHPQAVLISVPGVNFELGEALSPTAERGMRKALQEIRRLVQEIESQGRMTTRNP